MSSKISDKLKLSKQGKKITAAAAAVALTGSILVSGTFAWQSISQTVKNEAPSIANPGGRLHDYFDGENKDVFVENFTDPNDNGVPIYARIRLDEYMEFGEGAGDPAADRGENGEITIIGTNKEGQTPDINDTDTWITHYLEPRLPQGGLALDVLIHEYWEWDMGGKTVYMPTFNKDKDSLEADINGTYAGPDGVSGPNPSPDGLDDCYEDYIDYTVNHTKTELEYYSHDLESTSGTPVTHTASETNGGQEARVITMQEWMAWNNDSSETKAPLDACWVYDSDGWAYWSKPIEPGQTTGPLLNGIKRLKDPGEDSYYAVNVVGQFATAGDWGSRDDNTGFYTDGITEDGLLLLNTISGLLPKVTYFAVNNRQTIFVPAGTSYELKADIIVQNATGKASETHVNWEFADEAAENVWDEHNAQFSPTADMAGTLYKVKAISTFDPSFTDDASIYVIPSGTSAVTGENGKLYVDFGDNSYKLIEDWEIKEPYIYSGKDGTIGTGDDKKNVVESATTTTWGKKFLGPDADGIYRATGPDGKLGTDDDILLVSDDPFPTNLRPATWALAITTVEGNPVAATFNSKYETPVQFIAQVTVGGRPTQRKDATWTVTGGNGTATIDENGELNLGTNKVGARLTVTAKAKGLNNVSTSFAVVLEKWSWEDLNRVTPGDSTHTVYIDGIDWYVLAKDNGNALLWTTTGVYRANFGANCTWKGSSSEAYLNNTWLPTKSVLSAHAVEAVITTRKPGTAAEWIESTDKVFFLSEADILGTIGTKATSDSRDYTFGNRPLITSGMSLKDPTRGWWTRSPYNATQIARIDMTGNLISYQTTDDGLFRPALWVEMPAEEAP